MKKYKNIAKRIVSGMTAAVMLSSYLVFPELPGTLKFLETKFTTFAAESDGYTYDETTKYCNIETREGLVNYSKVYADDKADHSEDTINLAFGSGDTNEECSGDFVSFGDENAPFRGTLRSGEGSTNILTLDKALFDYISDEATITVENLTIRRYVDAGNQALLANHVKHGDTSTAKTWSVTIGNVYDENSAPLVYNFAGVIGEMQDGSKLKLNVTNNLQPQDNGGSDKYPQVSGEGNKGFICDTIQNSAELTVDMNSNSVCQVSSSNASAGGLVGSVGEKAKLTVNITNSDVTLFSVSGATNAGGVVGTMATDAKVTLNLNGHDFSCTSVTSENGNAGGIVGKMEYDETTTEVKTSLSITNSGENTKTLDSIISGANAGGLVGSGTNCTITLGDRCQVSGTITGTDSTGGVFGSYTNGALDGSSSISIDKYNINCTLTGKNAGGLFGSLTNTMSSIKFTDSATVAGENETFPALQA